MRSVLSIRFELRRREDGCEQAEDVFNWAERNELEIKKVVDAASTKQVIELTACVIEWLHLGCDVMDPFEISEVVRDVDVGSLCQRALLQFTNSDSNRQLNMSQS